MSQSVTFAQLVAAPVAFAPANTTAISTAPRRPRACARTILQATGRRNRQQKCQHSHEDQTALSSNTAAMETMMSHRGFAASFGFRVDFGFDFMIYSFPSRRRFYSSVWSYFDCRSVTYSSSIQGHSQ